MRDFGPARGYPARGSPRLAAVLGGDANHSSCEQNPDQPLTPCPGLQGHPGSRPGMHPMGGATGGYTNVQVWVLGFLCPPAPGRTVPKLYHRQFPLSLTDLNTERTFQKVL